MKLFKTFILIVLVLFLVFFLTQNSAKVAVDLVFIKFPSASLSMVIFGSLAVGVLFGYLFAIFSILATKAEVKGLQSKNKRLSNELNDLRNVAIDEGLYDNNDGDF
tara:strand:+ start:36 stop:353 length:318 start_codon:yes stop_codon:yes gene_type:complete